jgi:hypothetical protein
VRRERPREGRDVSGLPAATKPVARWCAASAASGLYQWAMALSNRDEILSAAGHGRPQGPGTAVPAARRRQDDYRARHQALAA